VLFCGNQAEVLPWDSFGKDFLPKSRVPSIFKV
jgi:hypothetical protein